MFDLVLNFNATVSEILSDCDAIHFEVPVSFQNVKTTGIAGWFNNLLIKIKLRKHETVKHFESKKIHNLDGVPRPLNKVMHPENCLFGEEDFVTLSSKRVHDHQRSMGVLADEHCRVMCPFGPNLAYARIPLKIGNAPDELFVEFALANHFLDGVKTLRHSPLARFIGEGSGYFAKSVDGIRQTFASTCQPQPRKRVNF